MTNRVTLKPYSGQDPLGFLRQAFQDGVDDKTDVLGSIKKRFKLIHLKSHHHVNGLSLADRFQRLHEASVLRVEALDMFQAYCDLVDLGHDAGRAWPLVEADHLDFGGIT